MYSHKIIFSFNFKYLDHLPSIYSQILILISKNIMDPLAFKNIFLCDKFARLGFKNMDTPSNT
jgi:hypothetical protein